MDVAEAPLFVCGLIIISAIESSDSSLYANFLLLNESRHLVMLGTRSALS